jgi:hypothetical protein
MNRPRLVPLDKPEVEHSPKTDKPWRSRCGHRPAPEPKHGAPSAFEIALCSYLALVMTGIALAYAWWWS